MAGEHNIADYFSKHHPASHHQSQRRIYLVSTADARKYACYRSPIDLQVCVKSLPAQGNVQHTDTVSLLCEKETDGKRQTGQLVYHGIGGDNIDLIGTPLI